MRQCRECGDHIPNHAHGGLCASCQLTEYPLGHPVGGWAYGKKQGEGYAVGFDGLPELDQRYFVVKLGSEWWTVDEQGRRLTAGRSRASACQKLAVSLAGQLAKGGTRGRRKRAPEAAER